MNVHVPKKQLSDALSQVERIVPNRSSNPGLSLVRVDLDTEGLTLSGSNMDIDIRASIAADVSSEGSVALPAQVFSQVVRALPGELVELEFTDREVEIRSASYDTKLQLADLGSAPVLTFPGSYAGKIDAQRFATALTNVRYAAAVAEYQAIFRGVKVEFNDKKTRAIATDGFRLAYHHLTEATGLEGNIVLPGRSVEELARVLGSGDTRSAGHLADLSFDEVQLSVTSGRTSLNVKLMEGSFPDYERVIPSQFPVQLELRARALAEAVARVAVVADKTANNRVDLFVKDGTLQITAEGGYGRSQEALEVSQEGSESQMSLAYNAKYLVDALGPIDGDLRFSLSGPSTPSVLTSPEESSYLAMVVPLRI